MTSSDSDKEIFDIYEKLIAVLPQVLAEEEAGETSSQPPKRRKRRVIQRDRIGANDLLMQHYFVENPVYPDEQFTRRFRMTKNMFIRIAQDIENFREQPLPPHFAFFQVGLDALRNPPFSVYQKCTAALRQLAYGVSGDALDEYLQMSECTANLCLQNFCKCVYDIYRNIYLRKPTADDIRRLYQKHEEIHGLPGMLGSIDCMHWAWKNCPTAWKGQYTRGDHGHPTIMLEAVASYDLWIWHSFFGVAGSNNDINVLQQSPLFTDLLNDMGPPSSFQVNGNTYRNGYYLADDIYPEWSSFVKSFSAPQDNKRRKFKQAQESARKDVERAFGVLQGRWSIISNPTRSWSENKLKRIMYTCIILHNMNVEERGYAISSVEPWYTPPTNHSQRTFAERCEIRYARSRELRDKDTHHGLRHDLVEHVWRLDN